MIATADPLLTVRSRLSGRRGVGAAQASVHHECGSGQEARLVRCQEQYGAGLWRTLWEAGRAHGLIAGGYRAIDSLRLEKRYRAWAADITPDETPYEAGLGFCVKKEASFTGARALGVGSDEGPAKPAKRLRCVVLADPRSVALGNEPVRVGGEVLGRVTSGGYGHTVARSIAYAYLPAAVELGTAVEVDIFGEWIAGEVTREPLFDPQGERIRA